MKSLMIFFAVLFTTHSAWASETISNVFKSITQGLDGTSMVGFPGIPAEGRWALAYYVLTFKEKK